MTSSSRDLIVSPLTSVLWPGAALLLALGCSTLGCSKGGSATVNTGGSASGGTTSSGGSTANGGNTNTGGTTNSGGATGTGGTTGKGGNTSTGGATSAGGSPASGGTLGSGGTSTPGSGGAPGGGGAGRGGSTGTGGVTGAAGITGRDGGPGNGGTPDSGGVAVDGGTSTVNCSAAMPTGGNTFTGTNINGSAGGLNYGIWTNGSGGSITVFPNVHAFSTSWSESKDFLAHLGLDFNSSKSYTAYGTITAQFAETKSGTAGGFSMIGMYGWTHSPCVEWYINEDSWNGLAGRGSVTAVIDGETYYLSTTTTTGTGGANACESGHTGGWTQMVSTRKTAHQCGTVTVSDHFAAWEKQGWKLGTLSSVHINVEVGGGTGTIQFPVAEVTTTSK